MPEDTSLEAAEIIYLLHHLSETVAKQSDQMLMERLGIGYSQFKIMWIVQNQPSTTQRHIAHQLGQTEASVSRQVKLLHEMGLASTIVNRDNRREHHVRLTPKGIRLHQEVVRVLALSFRPVSEHLGEKQQKQLFATLITMHTQLCVRGKIGACRHYQHH